MIALYSWILLVLAVLSDAYGDAKNDILRKRFHVVELLSMVFLVCGFCLPLMLHDASIKTFLLLLTTYTLARMGFFNLTYNKTRGLDYKYVGNTDGVFDKIINKFPNWIVLTIYIVSIFFSGVTAHLVVK